MSAFNRFIVMDRFAEMPGSWKWGRYRRVGVVELTATAQHEGRTPKILSNRSRDIVRVVDTWERQYEGTTPRCAYQRALVAANELADKLNAVAQHLPGRESVQ